MCAIIHTQGKLSECSHITKEISEQGYSVLENVLSEQECNLYKSLLERDYKQYSPYYANTEKTDHHLNEKRYEKVVYNMHNKDIRYYPLFDHPTLEPILKKQLQEGSYQNSEPYHLLNISARCPVLGAPAQQLHLDSNLPGGGSYPLIMVIIYMLDDFNSTNGTTRLVPGSHKGFEYAENGKNYPNEVSIEAKAGSVLLFNGALWHGSTVKSSKGSRWAIVLGYGRWFIKPSFDFIQNIPESIFSNISEHYKELLGFKSSPPIDEFTRITRKSSICVANAPYTLPKTESDIPLQSTLQPSISQTISQKKVFLQSEADQWFQRNFSVDGKQEKNKDPLLRLAKTLSITPKNVLEIGCSDGWRLNELNQLWQASCRGIDPSFQAILAGKKQYPKLNLFRATAEQLPFKNQSFDCLIFGFCLYLCDRKDLFKIAYEVDRVLQPGGSILIIDFYSPFAYQNPYHHVPGLFSNKMNYNCLFTWHPEYRLVEHKVEDFYENYFNPDEPDQQIATSHIVKCGPKQIAISPFQNLNKPSRQ